MAATETTLVDVLADEWGLNRDTMARVVEDPAVANRVDQVRRRGAAAVDLDELEADCKLVALGEDP